MKYLLLLAGLFFLSAPSVAQRRDGDTVLRYLDGSLRLTTKGEAVFYGVSFKQGDHWYLHAVYPDTGTLVQAYFRDHKLEVADGPFVLYHRKRVPAQVGQYRNGYMEGAWLLYYEHGKVKDSGAYERGSRTGTWKRYYPDGTLEAEGAFQNALQEGLWTWYYAHGGKSAEEWYRGGKLERQLCYDSSGRLTGDACPVLRDARLRDFGDYRAYVQERLLWPEAALKEDLEGAVTVAFRVDTQGVLQDLQVQGTHPILTDAVRRFFETLPPWEPAVQHNRVREWQDRWVIPFRR